jgi:hypothetical protein
MKSTYLYLGLAVLVVLVVVVAAAHHKKKKVECSADKPCPAPRTCTAEGVCAPAPRQKNIADCGYGPGGPISPAPRGWYDIQKQGVKNDYCRMVGGGKEPVYFSCALAGARSQATPDGQVAYGPKLPSEPLSPADNCYIQPKP